MIDCSHGNSSKKHENQPLVAKDIAAQVPHPNPNQGGRGRAQARRGPLPVAGQRGIDPVWDMLCNALLLSSPFSLSLPPHSVLPKSWGLGLM